MTPRAGENDNHEWGSMHVSPQDLRDFVDDEARVFDFTPFDILTIDISEG